MTTVFEIVWWHWIILGIVLAALEIFLPSFIALLFGFGAIVVGLVAWVFPGIGLAWLILLWVLASSGFVLMWFRYLKPQMVDRTPAGIAREAAIGEAGQVLKAPVEGGRGRVRFTLPVLGEDEWDFICTDPVNPGDRVIIKDFSGNTLVVTRL